MNKRLKVSPVRFTPDLEEIQPDEPKTAREIAETMLSIAEKTYADSGHATRAVHAKSHGLLEARLEVLPGLAGELAQGIFARPGTYDAIIRLSTTPGDLLPDSVSTPRGLALKVLNVEGERLPGSEQSHSQDFVLVNGPTFSSPSGKAFLRSLKLLAATTDRLDRTKEFVASAFRKAEAALEVVGSESATFKTLGGHPQTSILGECFFSQLPLRYGDFMAKIEVAPASENLKALTGVALDCEDGDVIRHEVMRFFETETAMWDVKVQLCTDLKAMPIEGIDHWSEEQSPFLTVARLVAEPQVAWDNARVAAVDDGMHFSPWNGIVAHQPIGAIMRLRRLAYQRSAAFRSQRNRVPVSEPTLCPFGSGTSHAVRGL